jgi:hypothetical protein
MYQQQQMPVPSQHGQQHPHQLPQMAQEPAPAAPMQQSPLQQWAPEQPATAPDLVATDEFPHFPVVEPLGIDSLGEMRPGITGSRVGLLPGLCPQIMDIYLPVRIFEKTICFCFLWRTLGTRIQTTDPHITHRRTRSRNGRPGRTFPA